MGRTNYIDRVFDGKYRILRLLGTGGMGSVYLGQHEIIGRKVAVKLLHTEFAAKREFLERFYREARAAVSIGHKNVIDILDLGVSPENEPYLVMEYLEGECLAHMIQRTGPIDLPSACAIIEPTLEALAAAHENGIIHRDLKPENIFLAHQRDEAPLIKIIDFGISKLTNDTEGTKLTQTGTLLGSPAYMSPEQVQGKQSLDTRTDLYAVGVILYELLTGKLPFNGPHPHALLLSIVSDAPCPPADAYSDFPAAAEPLITALLQKDPDDRPPSARAVLTEWLPRLSRREDRAARLSQYVSGVIEKNVAGGDVGPVITDLQEEESLPHLTPSGWVGTLVRKGRRAKRSAVAVSGLAFGVILLLIWFGVRRAPAPDDARAVTVAAAPLQTNTETVQVLIRGLPTGATILVDNLAVPRNPFTVGKSKRMIKLRIHAAGHTDFNKWIVPDRDQTIIAKLTPISEEPTPQAVEPADTEGSGEAPLVREVNGAGEGAPRDKQARPSTRKRDAAKTSPRIMKSGKDIKYLGSFDE